MSDLEMIFPVDELTAYCGLHIIPYVRFASKNTWRKEFFFYINFYFEHLSSINWLDSELDSFTGETISTTANSKNGRLRSFSKFIYFFKAAWNTSSHYLRV